MNTHDHPMFPKGRRRILGQQVLVVAILRVIVPGILDGHCLCDPHEVGLHKVKPEKEWPLSTSSLWHSLLGASSLGPTRNHWLGHTALGPCAMVWVATELLFLCQHGISLQDLRIMSQVDACRIRACAVWQLEFPLSYQQC